MSFRRAVEGAPGLAGAYREGLQGLKGEHRGLVACDDPRELCGSVDLDGALAAARLNDPRWDYGICRGGGRAGEVVWWVEVHPANGNHVAEVLRKLEWLKVYLNGSGGLGGLERRYRWIAPGAVAISPQSRQARLLSQAGLGMPKKRLKLG